MQNKVVLKDKIGFVYVKMHGFHGNPSYDSQEWEKPYKITCIYGVTYHREQNLVPN